MKIKEWSADDRPREKMMENGARALSDAELLAIIIGSGSRNKTAVELSQEILKQSQDSLSELGKLSYKDIIRQHKGIGPAKAVSIVSALELGRRRSDAEPVAKAKITSSLDIYNVLRPLLADIPHEEFWTLYLNRSNHIIRKQMISKGGITETTVDIRLILKDAIQSLACSIILCHNHPSGNTRPSNADDSFTTKIREAAQLMDINVLDHIIICDNTYYSYADHGRI